MLIKCAVRIGQVIITVHVNPFSTGPFRIRRYPVFFKKCEIAKKLNCTFFFILIQALALFIQKDLYDYS